MTVEQVQTTTWSIGVLADRFDVSTQTLRVWERRRRIPRALRTPGGHRRYSIAHVRAIAELMGVRIICED